MLKTAAAHLERQWGQACVIVIIYGVFGIILDREDNDNNAGLTPHMTPHMTPHLFFET